jgi:hypothetical protein
MLALGDGGGMGWGHGGAGRGGAGRGGSREPGLASHPPSVRQSNATRQARHPTRALFPLSPFVMPADSDDLRVRHAGIARVTKNR